MTFRWTVLIGCMKTAYITYALLVNPDAQTSTRTIWPPSSTVHGDAGRIADAQLGGAVAERLQPAGAQRSGGGAARRQASPRPQRPAGRRRIAGAPPRAPGAPAAGMVRAARQSFGADGTDRAGTNRGGGAKRIAVPGGASSAKDAERCRARGSVVGATCSRNAFQSTPPALRVVFLAAAVIAGMTAVADSATAVSLTAVQVLPRP